MILEKRNDLEKFIREQTLGPGAAGYRYVDITDPNLLVSNFCNRSSLEYENEVINNAPGSLYSTAILFPVDGSMTAINEPDPEPFFDDVIQDAVVGAHENINGRDVNEEGSLSLNQMYPSSMGLTCSLDKKICAFNEIDIKVEVRYYEKVPRGEILEKYGLLLEQDFEIFDAFRSSLDPESPFRRNLMIRELGENKVLSLTDISPEDVGYLKSILREIEKSNSARLGSDRSGQNLSGYKEYLFRKLRYETVDRVDQIEIAKVIKQIEAVECSIYHLVDLVNIYDRRGYGLWKSKVIKKSILIPGIFPVNSKGKTVYSYKKYPELADFIKIDLDHGDYAALSLNLQLSKDSRGKTDDWFLKVQLINTSTEFTVAEGDSRYYSVFNEVVNQKSFFGVKVSVSSEHIIPYKNILHGINKIEFNEDEITATLYDQFKDFGVGHGTSVKWNVKEKLIETEYVPSFETPDIDPNPKIKNSLVEKGGMYVPEEVFSSSMFMQFKSLSTLSILSDLEVIEGLKDFVTAYANWISKKRESFAVSDFKALADQELTKCEKDKDRMLINIHDILSGDANSDNLSSFRLMNSAMFMQLWHSVNVKNDTIEKYLGSDFSLFNDDFYKKCNDELFERGTAAAWRPFQLAFILLNLDGIFHRSDDETWEKRNNLVDLVWFPTGGGKTEAYLGIIALTIINRRKVSKESGGGTAVLMRYTLRLLTLQQFQRATLLIMALELIRRWGKYQLGQEPIYIGLWVGEGSLPNSLEDLKLEYEKIRSAQNNGQANYSSKIPFDKCPWCGYPLNKISYESIEDSRLVFDFNRVELSCSRPGFGCSFSVPPRRKRSDQGPIPVSLCDEEIYQHPPALLFGTVDKFAQLAHKVSNENKNRHKDSRRIFGNGNWEAGKPSGGYLTPDLIIQDELHLLLGPLGSSVGLFESAIDQLCTRSYKDISLRPKVISSTATTRNTELQIMALFDRKLNLFPKPGIECDDSFYSFYERSFSSTDKDTAIFRSKRKYYGILPTGRTQMWMQMRLSALLLVHRAVYEAKSLGPNGYPIITDYGRDLVKVLDNYHTMLTYFNSIREVGKTESQIDTYIIKEIRRVFNRVLRPGKMMHCLYTYSLSKGELTGRLSGEDVKKELDRVSSKWNASYRFAHINLNSDKSAGSSPPDIVVATNMISVGIDVSRFNTIIINAMPRNLAEYIQATSRVARNTYGAVFTVHHPFRARDISHYEKFIEFHEKMYSYVEPISITPFTQKAVNRYLGLYLATILRHLTEFTERTSASIISNKTQIQIDELVKELSKYFFDRQARLSMMDVDPLVKNLLKRENVYDIEGKLRQAIGSWRKFSDEVRDQNKQLVFNNKSKVGTVPQEQLYVDIDEYESNIHSRDWQIPQSLRVIEQEAVIKIK